MSAPAPDETRAAGRWAIRVLIAVAVSGGILALLLTQVDVAQVTAVLREASSGAIVLGLFVYAGLSAVRAWRFRLMSTEAPFSVLCAITSVHQLLLRVMPMRTGELGFAWLMRKSGSAGFAQSLVGLLLLRILDLSTVLVLYALALALARTSSGGADAPILLVGAAAVVATLLALSLRRILPLGARVLGASLRLVRLDRFERVKRVQRALDDAVAWSLSLSPGVLLRATLLTLFQWVLSFAFVFVVAIAMHLEVSAPQAVLGGMGTVVGSMLPVPGIGTFGGLEAGWAAGFALVGVPSDEAIASGIGFSVISFGYSMVTASVAMVWLRVRSPRGGAAAR